MGRQLNLIITSKIKQGREAKPNDGVSQYSHPHASEDVEDGETRARDDTKQRVTVMALPGSKWDTWEGRDKEVRMRR